MPTRSLDTPLGRLRLESDGAALTRIAWDDTLRHVRDPLLDEAARQISAYFAGELRVFDLPLGPAESRFQQRIRAAMQAIAYGCTRTYGDIARELGTAARAVGRACGDNPLPLVVPCHRVVAGHGLGGYSGGRGRESKRRLLEHEGALPAELW